MWEYIEFGKIADFKNGINFEKEQKGDNGIPTIDVKNMYSDSCYINTNDLYRVNKIIDSDYYLTKGDLLFVRSSLKEEGVGWTSLFNGESKSVTFCGFIIRARIKEESREEIDPKYLTYFFRSDIPRKELVSGSGRVAITNINQGLLKSIKIPKPSFSEQRKIAHVLSTVQKAIEQQDKLIRTTTELKKALMQKLFTEGTRGEPQKETEIGLVPESWEVVRIGDMMKITSGGTPSRKNKEYYGGDILWVKSGELEDNIIQNTEEKITEQAIKESSAKLFPLKTLLIAMYGATVGKTSILEKEAATNQAVCAILSNEEIFNQEFLRHYFITIRENLLKQRYGGAQPNISQTIIKNTLVPKPNIKEQNAIADSMTLFDSKICYHKSRKDSLTTLFKTLLHELMTGQRRVYEVEFEVLQSKTLAKI